MKPHRLVSVVFAIVLQALPLCRVACVNPAVAPSGFAVLIRSLAALGAVLGSVDAVSGASAVISGVVKYPYSPLNPITTNAVAGVGQLFLYRIVVTGGLQDTNYNYFNASPLPPGLSINTNLGGDGFIIGTSTVASVTFPVTLTAGNKLYDDLGGAPIHLDIIITITNSSGTLKPTITSQPQNRTVIAGAPASFSVTASGAPAPSYQWRKNGGNVGGASASTYTIAAATTNDAAGYSVVVSNSVGSVTSTVATLTVLVPPSITAQPVDRITLVGGTAMFSVGASGSAPLTYQWRKGTSNMIGETNSIFNRSGVGLADAGEYSVTVSNAAGVTPSQVARLQVLSPPTLAAPTIGNNAVTLSFLQEAGAGYTLLYSGALVGEPWLALTNLPPAGAASTVAITHPMWTGNRFYKIQMTIP